MKDVKNENVRRWLANENLQSFVRQVVVDTYVASKNGIKESEIREALNELRVHLKRQLSFPKMSFPKNSRKEFKNNMNNY